jgi:hypothetical protein
MYPWALRHIISLSIYAEELLYLSSASSVIFDSRLVPTGDLQNIKSKAHQLVTYVLSTGFGTSGMLWHERIVAASFPDGKSNVDGDISRLVVDLVRKANEMDTFRESRILHTVLQQILSDATREEADQWMMLARQLEKTSKYVASLCYSDNDNNASTAPQASMSITLSVTRFAPEPPRLDRYRNELAANALGVPPSHINSDGLALLRKLSMTVPDPESDVVFLPQTRAVNFVKACQQWVGSSEEVEESVESEMTFLFLHLAPILQDVPGSHWDFIFDVIENNMEVRFDDE